MFDKTDTKTAPWTVIAADNKLRARIEVLEAVVKGLGDGVDCRWPDVDPKVREVAEKALGRTLKL
jgi:hypothetical protein